MWPAVWCIAKVTSPSLMVAPSFIAATFFTAGEPHALAEAHLRVIGPHHARLQHPRACAVATTWAPLSRASAATPPT